MKDNNVLAFVAFCNLVKDIVVLLVFGFLSYHFENIWIMLMGAIFIGGIHATITSKSKDDEKEDNKDEK